MLLKTAAAINIAISRLTVVKLQAFGVQSNKKYVLANVAKLGVDTILNRRN